MLNLIHVCSCYMQTYYLCSWRALHNKHLLLLLLYFNVNHFQMICLKQLLHVTYRSISDTQGILFPLTSRHKKHQTRAWFKCFYATQDGMETFFVSGHKKWKHKTFSFTVVSLEAIARLSCFRNTRSITGDASHPTHHWPWSVPQGSQVPHLQTHSTFFPWAI